MGKKLSRHLQDHQWFYANQLLERFGLRRRPEVGLIGKRLAFGFTHERQKQNPCEIDKAHDGASFAIIAPKDIFHEGACLQGAYGGKNTAEVKAKALACGTNSGREQLWEIKWKPAIKCSGECACDKDCEKEPRAERIVGTEKELRRAQRYQA